MASTQELQSIIDGLQDSVDSMQADVTTLVTQNNSTIATLNQTIADLQAQINAGGGATPEQLQGWIEQLNSTKADVESTYASLSTPVEPPAPAPEETV